MSNTSLLIIGEEPDYMGELETAGFSPTVSPDNSSALPPISKQVSKQHIDICLIDAQPPLDVISLVQHLRTISDIGIVVLTDDPATRLSALEKGADDCFGKPEGAFDTHRVRELLVRMKNLAWRLRHQHRPLMGQQTFAGWVLDMNTRELASPAGERYSLSISEFNLLLTLTEHAGEVMSRDQLMKIVCNRAWYPEDRHIDVLVSQLRRKFRRHSDDFITTVQGVGYVFSTETLPIMQD